MQKGNYDNSVQIPQGEIRTENNVFEANRELIRIAQSGDASDAMEACEELVVINRGLVRSIAIRFRERGVEIDDLIQIGTIGLLRAIRSFDLDRGTCFSTYAVPMIFGEIRRSLRDEGPVKVSRYYKKLGVDLVRAKNEINQHEGREAHIKELAAAVGVSVEDAAIALDAMSPISSLSDVFYGEDDGILLEDKLADQSTIEENERLLENMDLYRAISAMPKEWQKIVILRYYRSKTQEQVARIMGLSQVKISREEKKIVSFLKKEMKAD